MNCRKSGIESFFRRIWRNRANMCKHFVSCTSPCVAFTEATWFNERNQEGCVLLLKAKMVLRWQVYRGIDSRKATLIISAIPLFIECY